MNENKIKEIVAKIEKLPLTEQLTHLKALKEKLKGQESRDSNPTIKLLKAVLAETTTHNDLTDNDQDVHPQYINKERLDSILSQEITKIEERQRAESTQLSELLAATQSEVVTLSEQVKQSSILQLKFSEKIDKQVTKLKELKVKLSESKDTKDVDDIKVQLTEVKTQIDPLQIEINTLRRSIASIEKIELEAGENIVIKESKSGNKKTYTIASTAKSVTNIGGGGLILDTVYGRLDGLASGQSVLVAGQSTLVAGQSVIIAGLSLKLQNDPYILAVQALGSPLKAQTVGANLLLANSATSLTDNAMRYTAISLSYGDTISGAMFFQRTQGAFTGDNENSITLYSIAGITVTKIAGSSNNEAIWKGTANSIQQVPFLAPIYLTAGVYFAGFLYNNGVSVTTPQIAFMANQGSANQGNLVFGNSAKLYASISSQNTSPDAETMANFVAVAAAPWVGLY